MRGRERCDLVIRLIDEAFAELGVQQATQLVPTASRQGDIACSPDRREERYRDAMAALARS